MQKRYLLIGLLALVLAVSLVAVACGGRRRGHHHQRGSHHHRRLP